jgi:hypothetical protein
MEAAFLVPVKGLLVRDPQTKEPLPENGEIKPMIGADGRYWRRRLIDCTVKIGKQHSTPSVMSKKLRRK